MCRGLPLYGVLSVIFICMLAWSNGKSCVAFHVYLVAMYGLANDMSEEVGWCVELYGILIKTSMLFSMLVVSICCCMNVPLLSVHCVLSHVLSCAL